MTRGEFAELTGEGVMYRNSKFVMLLCAMSSKIVYMLNI
jgi:hypothetical protein